MVQITLQDQACHWLAISFGHCIRLGVRFSVATSWYLTCFLINHFDPFSQGTTFGDRAINVLGLLVFQVGFYITSKNRAEIPW
jgi:hypothetical protein